MIKTEIVMMPNGYVVWAKITNQDEDDFYAPLKCFGWCMDAAKMFQRFINNNNMDTDKLEQQVELWAMNYSPYVIYTYPEINMNKTEIILRKQR